MDADGFRLLIERGDLEGVRGALASDSGLANRTIGWFSNQENQSDPLHFVSDCVAHGWLVNGTEEEITRLLLAHGAAVNGSDGRESPLIGSVSLGAERVTKVLVDAGADTEATPLFWAAHGYGPDGPKDKKNQVGAARLLIEAGARADASNKRGLSALELSRTGPRPEMYELLHQSIHGTPPVGVQPSRGPVGGR